MAAYYNEIEPFAAQWLRNLIQAGLIADGEVDERSIVDVSGSDLRGFTQCHFFAGIGVWSYALRKSGWSDDREVWTGSCPCQTHSYAARGRNKEPDWWPELARLISSRMPRAFFGEQVAAAKNWIAFVRAELEEMGYRFAAVNLAAVAFGANHIRPRIYFAGDTDSDCKSISTIYEKTPRMQWDAGISQNLLRNDGASRDMACLRAFGNALEARTAQAFIESYMECRP